MVILISLFKIYANKISYRPPNEQTSPLFQSYYGGELELEWNTSTAMPLSHPQRHVGSVHLDSSILTHPIPYPHPTPAQDGGEWDQTLRNLKVSIDKVRRDLGQTKENLQRKRLQEEEEKLSNSTKSTSSNEQVDHHISFTRQDSHSSWTAAP